MRLLSVLFIAVSACGRSAPPAEVVPKQDIESKAAALVLPRNRTGLAAWPLDSPIAKLGVHFSAPEFGERIAVAAPRVYEVALELGVSELAPSSIEVALDGGRPRRLFPPQLTIALGQLLAAGDELRAGEHWLFAAPVLASGLVPREGTGAPRVAIARRFSIGSGSVPDSRGAIWLRKPEGTYNGQSAALVLFDAYAFEANGAASSQTPTLFLRGPENSGELRLPAPFALAEVPSGAYEVRASAQGLAGVSVSFNVNRELGDGP